jgi:uncharacterized protein YneF (UPF0154 family)
MGAIAIRPWHITTLLCCVVVVAGIAGGIYFAVRAARRR